MLERSLRIVAITLSLIVAIGFSLFALDEFNRASSAQRDELAGFERPDPTAAGERRREQRHSNAREYIDDANDVLLKPFAFAEVGSRWSQRALPTVLALFVYGFVLAYLARFMKGRGTSPVARFVPHRT